MWNELNRLPSVSGVRLPPLKNQNLYLLLSTQQCRGVTNEFFHWFRPQALHFLVFFLCVFFKNVFSFYRLNIPRFAWGLFGAMSLAARFFLLRIWIYGPFVSFTFTSSGGGISVYTVLILNLCTNSFEEGVKPFCWIFDFRENHKKKKKFTFKRAFGFIYN